MSRLVRPDGTPIRNSKQDLDDAQQKALSDLVKKHALAVEALTEQQLVELLRQIIASGDIMRNVNVEEGKEKQSMLYIPFARQEEYRNRIKQLEQLLTKNNIQLP